MFLTPQAKYIFNNLPTEEEPNKELKIQGFYIKFGFKYRRTAEDSFISATEAVFNYPNTSSQQKEYLTQAFIQDDYVVFDTSILDEYWKATERHSTRENILKRQQDQASSCLIPKKKPKDRHLSSTLSKNKIIDLTNEGPSGQSHTVAFQTARQNVTNVPTLLDLPNEYEQSIKGLFVKNVHINAVYKNSLKMVLNSSNEDVYFYKLLCHLVEAHQLHPKLFIISNLPEFSERDLDIFFWGRLFVLLFCDYPAIILKSGERPLPDSSFKLDYKFSTYVKGKFIDLANIEVGRAVTETKVKEDHQKLLLEAKTMINNIIKSYSFICPASVPVTSIQICGLKGDMLETQLAKPKSYVVNRLVERLRTPLTPSDSTATNNFMKALNHFKTQVINTADNVLQLVNEYDDRRSSFGKTLSPKTRSDELSHLNWVDDHVDRT